MREIERNLLVRSLTPPVASSTLRTHHFAPYNENAYANDQVFDQLTHPLKTRIANDFECTITPANLQPPLTMESMTIFLDSNVDVELGARAMVVSTSSSKGH